MNIHALRLFIDVANRLSFAAVAEQTVANPSSVSRTIANIEDELGARLFYRTTRTMALTETGAAFLPRAKRIVDELDKGRDEARAAGASPRGTLRLTASVAYGERVLVPLLPDFRSAYPEIKTELLLIDSKIDLAGEGIDLAIRLGPEPVGQGVATKLADTTYRVCASPRYCEQNGTPRKPEDLAEHACLLFTLPAFRSEWVFRKTDGAMTRVPVHGDIAISSALSLRAAALADMGPCLLADWLIGDDLENGWLIELFPDHTVTATDFSTAAWLIYPDRAYLPKKTRVTIDFLKDRIARKAG